jgi:hypothetical protein
LLVQNVGFLVRNDFELEFGSFLRGGLLGLWASTVSGFASKNAAKARKK